MTFTSRKIQKACVLGWPVAHSRSPLIHGYWLRELGLRGQYKRVWQRPRRIKHFLENFQNTGLCGANITIPYKEIALKICDETDSVANEIGAVNTIWLEEGRLHGTNTDAYGFLTNLDCQVSGWDSNPGTALVIGAGGAARAVIWALKQRGFDSLNIVNRTIQKAESLSKQFPDVAKAVKWNELDRLLSTTQILINTTSLGMKRQPNLSLNLSRISESAVVCDLVYVPLETTLLRRARKMGLRCADGLGMLLHQAVPGFEKWFGGRPSVTDELRDLIVNDLEGDW